MRRLLTGIVFLMLSQILFAQYTVQGQAKLSNGKPASFATVLINDSIQMFNADANGYFESKELAAGQYNVKVFLPGQKLAENTVTISGSSVKGLEIKLTELWNDLPEFMVEGNTLTGGINNVGKVPGSAHYLSSKELQKYNYSDINRTLRAIPGINLQEEDGFGLRPNIGLRGTGVERSSKITVMEDGILMAPAPYTAPSAYYFPTIGRIQGIEVLKGSSQIKFGPFTTGGAINLISTVIPDKFSGRLDIMGGSFGMKNLHANVGNSHKNISYVVETFQYGADGFKTLNNNGKTGFYKQDYLAKVQVRTNAKAKHQQTLTFKIGKAYEKSYETYLGLTQDDFNQNPYQRYDGSQVDEMNTEQSQHALFHALQLRSNLSLSTSFYQTNFHRNWYKLDKVIDSLGNIVKISALLENPQDYSHAFAAITGNDAKGNNTLQVKANNRSYQSRGIQSILQWKLKGEKIAHKIQAGIRVHYDEIDRFQWVDDYNMIGSSMNLANAGTHGTESNRIEYANAIASFIQYEMQIGSLTLFPGLRNENIVLQRKDYGKNDPERTGIDLTERENTVNAFIPGLSLSYQFNENYLGFAGVHKGFSPPGTTEGTLPEESFNYEAGIKLDKNNYRGALTLFYSDYSNLLGADLAAAGGAGTTNLFNGGAATVQGIEFEYTYNILGNSNKYVLPVSLVYTYTDAFFNNSFDSDFDGWGTVQNGDELPYIAAHQFTIMASLEHKKYNFNISGRYTDEMRTAAGQGEVSAHQKIDQYFIVDASLNTQVHKNITAFVGGNNLTNAFYLVARRPAGLRPGMRRSLNLGAKVRF